jgi:hypothetical protein
MTLDDIAGFAAMAAEENPELADELNAFKDMKGVDTDMLRGVALYANRNFIYKGYATNISILAIEDPTLAAMPLSFITEVLEEQFKQNGAKILTQGVNEINNPSGVETEYIDIENNIIILGTKQTMDQRMVLFLANNKLIVVQLATPRKFAKDMLPVANDIGATIELLK